MALTTLLLTIRLGPSFQEDSGSRHWGPVEITHVPLASRAALAFSLLAFPFQSEFSEHVTHPFVVLVPPQFCGSKRNMKRNKYHPCACVCKNM